jgi:hypothetical protein
MRIPASGFGPDKEMPYELDKAIREINLVLKRSDLNREETDLHRVIKAIS